MFSERKYTYVYLKYIKKIYVKIGYSGYDSGKNVLLVIDPLRDNMYAKLYAIKKYKLFPYS